MTIKAHLKRHSGLIAYTLLNYGDKLLTFLIPLLALYVCKDKLFYTEIEYIYSLAAIVVIAIEGGLVTYFLYAYKESEDRDTLLIRVQRCFQLQFLIYAGIGLVGTLLFWLTDLPMSGTLFFVGIRTLFSYALWYLAIQYRLIDRPSRIFIASYAVNIASIILLLGANYFFPEISMPLFFTGQIALVAALLLGGVKAWRQLSWADLKAYLIAAWRYTWPVTLTVFLFMFVTNYGKIYARNYLTDADMYTLSFTQRLAMIIQLAHSSAVGYLSKGIFVDKGRSVHAKHLLTYSIMIAGSIGLVFLAPFGLEFITGQPFSLFTVHGLLLIAFTVLWCFGAFLEMYLNKLNKNILILLFAVIACAIYFTLLFSLPFAPLTRIATAMAASMIVNILLVSITLWRVIRTDATTFASPHHSSSAV